MIIMINIRKRGKVYQYCYEVGKVNGKRGKSQNVVLKQVFSLLKYIENYKYTS